MHQRLGRNRDACDTLDTRRCTYSDLREGASHGYQPHRDRCYDSGEDRSPSPGLPGPQAFGQHILNAAFPPSYRPPTNIPKYYGETNPELWLKDYRLSCQAGGVDSDNFIIRNLPLFLADSAYQNPKLGGPKRVLCGKLSGHIHASWEPIGSQKLPTEV